MEFITELHLYVVIAIMVRSEVPIIDIIVRSEVPIIAIIVRVPKIATCTVINYSGCCEN